MEDTATDLMSDIMRWHRRAKYRDSDEYIKSSCHLHEPRVLDYFQARTSGVEKLTFKERLMYTNHYIIS